jgi:hypothetical protein
MFTIYTLYIHYNTHSQIHSTSIHTYLHTSPIYTNTHLNIHSYIYTNTQTQIHIYMHTITLHLSPYLSYLHKYTPIYIHKHTPIHTLLYNHYIYTIYIHYNTPLYPNTLLYTHVSPYLHLSPYLLYIHKYTLHHIYTQIQNPLSIPTGGSSGSFRAVGGQTEHDPEGVRAIQRYVLLYYVIYNII